MTALTWLAGRNATHVMLCDEMQAAFAQLYPHATRFTVVPNVADEPVTSERPARAGAPFTIGMLSNLTFEKGLVEFVEIVEQAVARGVNIRGVLAGPAPMSDASCFIAARLARLGDRLEWVGPVSGQAKEDFFAGIDLFVFPTKYRTEALPLVLMESLVRGVPVIAPARGCICLFDRMEAAEIVPLSEDFVAKAVAAVDRLAADHALLARLSDAARGEGRAANSAHAAAQTDLVEWLVAGAQIR